MAVTIQTSPSTLMPANNPLVFTFSSTQTAQDNFSFVVELTVNGSVHSYHQVFQESSNYGKFDCSEILRTIVFSDLVTDGSLLTNYSNAIASYSIRVTDKYGDPPTQQGLWASSLTLYAFNGSLRHQDWINFDYTDYDCAAGNDKLHLTNFPRPSADNYYYVGLQESMFLGVLNSDNSTLFLSTSLYDVNGSLIGSTQVTSLGSGARLVVADVSPQTLISQTSHTSADFDQCYYYVVRFRNTTATTYNNEKFTIYIDTACTPFSQKRLHWLNKFGVWDSYSFTMYSEESGRVSRNSYQIEKGTWSDTNTWDYNLYNGEKVNYNTTVTERLRINSDWIKEDKYKWLVESLMASPRVYLEDSDIGQGTFEPVKITNSAYEKGGSYRKGLLNLTLDLERTYTYVSQLN